MSDVTDLDDGTHGELPTEIAATMARPDMWVDLPAGLEDTIVAAIAAETLPVAAAGGAPADAPADLATARRLGDVRSAAAAAPSDPTVARRSTLPWWLAAAAALAVVVTGVVLVTRSGSDEGGVEVALAATELAPGASATAVLEATPAGLRILLDTDGLPGAGDDEMYEAWISDGSIWVSAGTFHLRGGDGPIELWAGTADPRFHILTVTLEPIDGDARSSGQVVLRGEFGLATD